MHSSRNHFSFLVLLLLLTTGIIFVPSSAPATATIDEDGAKNILSQWEQNFLFLCQIYKNHEAIDELDQWDLDQCKKLWQKYYNEDYVTPITVNPIAYQFVICDKIIYPEGTDCDDPYNNMEDPINLNKKDKKKHNDNMKKKDKQEDKKKDKD